MRAATSPDASQPLRLVELPSQPLGPDDLRVRVRAIGVNPVDWKMRGVSPLGLAQRVLGPGGPRVVGVDFAGEVTEVGARVTDLRPGDRVVGGTDFSRGQRGSYADEVVARPDQCVKLPDAVSFDDAACLGVPGATAWQGLVEIGGIDRRPGARVLVLGASGGVGMVAVQLARALGAEVTGVCSARNAALVRGLGAEVIDYTAGDVFAAARARGPFDVVMNTVGSDAYPVRACRALLTPEGRLVLVVVLPSDLAPLAFDPRTRTVLGRVTRARLGPVVELVAKGALAVHVEARIPLAEAEEAHRRSRAGRVAGKLILVP